jgi:hypothetical protein
MECDYAEHPLSGIASKLHGDWAALQSKGDDKCSP